MGLVLGDRLGQPELGRHSVALRFARGAEGDAVSDDDAAGDLVGREPALREPYDLRGRGGLALAGDHQSSHVFSQCGVRAGKGHRLGHRGVGQKDLFDLARCDLFPAPVYHFFDPPDQAKVAVVVELAEVARPEPPLMEGLGRSCGVVPVLTEHAWAFDHHLSDPVGRRVGHPVTEEGDGCTKRNPHRAGPSRPGGQGRSPSDGRLLSSRTPRWPGRRRTLRAQSSVAGPEVTTTSA